MGHTIPHHDQLRDALQRGAEHLKQAIDCGVTALCLALEDIQAGDQANATRTPIAAEIAPAPIEKTVLTLSELAALLGRDTRTITKWVDDFGLPELRADAEKAEPLYYWPEVHAWLRRHQKNNRGELGGNGRIAPAPSNGTPPQATQRRS